MALSTVKVSTKKFVKNFKSGLVTFGILAATTSIVSMQDMVELSGRETPMADRWLATLVNTPLGVVVDKDSTRKVRPVFIKIESVDVHGNTKWDLRGLSFAPYPEMAKKLSAQMTINREGKADRPVMPPHVKKAGQLAAGSLFGAESLFERPDAKKTPLMAMSLPQNAELMQARALAKVDVKRKVETEKQIAQLNEAVKNGQKIDPVVTASVNPASLGDTIRSGYAPKSSDPRNAFDAVLLPKSQSRPNDPVVTAPVPKGRPSELAALDVEEIKKSGKVTNRRTGKKDHFWVNHKLPRSTFSKAQQRCLAAAVYFEARGEPVSGQAAVAQVVLNRVKNPAYPRSVCGVVYQNKHKRNACQFSFACDGIYDRVNNKRSWATAVKVAKDVSRGRNWSDSIGSSTHYHATYVRPRWARTMKRMKRVGRHIFYKTYGGGWS